MARKSDDTATGRSGTRQQPGSAPRANNNALAVSDNRNALRTELRGLTALKDATLREKIFHFGHDRVPARIVHRRPPATHEVLGRADPLSDLTQAGVFPSKVNGAPVFARCSAAGDAGRVHRSRDQCSLSLRFHADQSDWDLLGDNIPLSFLYDAIRLSDLIPSPKIAAIPGFARSFPACDSFGAFVMLMPESPYMLLWARYDHTARHSLRRRKGFGVDTAKCANAKITRDGMMQAAIPKRSANCKPNHPCQRGEEPDPRAGPAAIAPRKIKRSKQRLRARDRGSHQKQTHIPWRVMTETERAGSASARVCIMSNAGPDDLHSCMPSYLSVPERDLGRGVAAGLGPNRQDAAKAACDPVDLSPSDRQLGERPSARFDAAGTILMPDPAEKLVRDSADSGFVMDAFAHLRASGHRRGAKATLSRAGIDGGAGGGRRADRPDTTARGDRHRESPSQDPP